MITITIPRKTVAIERHALAAIGAGQGNEEKEILPEISDPVEFRVEGTVKAVDGDSCTVEVRFINGQRPDVRTEVPEAEADAESEKALRQQAEDADAGEED